MIRSEAPNPEQLLILARAGNRQALGELLELYRSYLTLLARLEVRRRLQGKLDPADAVQDAFLEAHGHFDQFRGATEAELLAWMRQIMATVLANLMRHYRGTKRRDIGLERSLADELDESSRSLNGSLIASSSSPSQRAVRREQAVLLADALDRLPANYREAIILHHLEGLSFPTVAERMNRSLDSVKKLWMRGLVQLRAALRDLT
jgi:RNA polymerase sigma-70 factor, ECF subfamily